MTLRAGRTDGRIHVRQTPDKISNPLLSIILKAGNIFIENVDFLFKILIQKAIIHNFYIIQNIITKILKQKKLKRIQNYQNVN